ncbi:neuropeptide CCHamide-1 receptor-like [Zootermopsis nevadensis]|uniref:Bombesin receptor subtype-3 n=1 Tax=Zootermopsis nevadensis TaxID=136037 RepID=A0A067QUF7_ZOONE|nr:neuropeptide CCHamide-1 receptor-like [Zootermopsis nevadensis]KDR12681.1 Bombesin receptor subtype-3 [Zootermopsis nevadensis]
MLLRPHILLAVILVSCVRTENLLHPEDTNGREYVLRSLSKLITTNQMLNEKLENASIEIDGFIFSQNESAARRTIDIVKGYIGGREEFIAQIHAVNNDANKLNLTQSMLRLGNSSFLNEVRWKQELNQTKNELSKLEKVLKLYKMLLKLNETNEYANNLTKQFKEEGKKRQLSNATHLARELVREIKSFIQEVSNVRNFTISHNLTGVITNFWIEQLLDIQYWEYLLKNKTEDLLLLEKTKIPVAGLINKYVRPTLFVIIFVVGLAENGVLITIFARYPKIRKYRNMIILNLSIADTLSLIVNLPVIHLYDSISWSVSLETAQVFMFYRFLCFGLSVFSALALCLQRFSTTLKYSARGGFILRQSTKHNCIILIATVWVLAILFAVPHSLYSCLYFEQCFNTNVELHSKIAITLFSIDLISLSIIPAIIITILNWLTVRHLKLRGESLPVSMPEDQKAYQKKLLFRSKNILILTPIIFAVTSLPYYNYITIASFLGTDINSLSYTIIKGVLYCMIFVNCSFNPVALYFTSGTFRCYINTHFFFCKRHKNKHRRQEKQQLQFNTENNTTETPL